MQTDAQKPQFPPYPIRALSQTLGQQLAIPAGEPLGRLLIQAGQQKLPKVPRDFHGTPGPKIIMQSAQPFALKTYPPLAYPGLSRIECPSDLLVAAPLRRAQDDARPFRVAVLRFWPTLHRLKLLAFLFT